MLCWGVGGLLLLAPVLGWWQYRQTHRLIQLQGREIARLAEERGNEAAWSLNRGLHEIMQPWLSLHAAPVDQLPTSVRVMILREQEKYPGMVEQAELAMPHGVYRFTAPLWDAELTGPAGARRCAGPQLRPQASWFYLPVWNPSLKPSEYSCLSVAVNRQAIEKYWLARRLVGSPEGLVIGVVDSQSGRVAALAGARDAPRHAAIVAREIGLSAASWPPSATPEGQGAGERDASRLQGASPVLLTGAVAPGMPGEGGGWRVVVWHSEGSLEDILARSLRRNAGAVALMTVALAAGLGVLLFALSRMGEVMQQQLRFASAVSHEWRTPLAGIQAIAQNQADGLAADADKTREYGCLMLEQVRRLRTAYEHALAFARIGRIPTPALEPVRLREIAATAVAESGVAARIDVEDGLSARAQKELLLLVLANLIANAVRHADGKGLEIVGRRTGSRVELIVLDRGPGFSPGEMQRLGMPFMRGKAASARQSPGVGLGLSLCRAYMTAMNGEIRFEHAGPGAKVVLNFLGDPA